MFYLEKGDTKKRKSASLPTSMEKEVDNYQGRLYNKGTTQFTFWLVVRREKVQPRVIYVLEA